MRRWRAPRLAEAYTVLTQRRIAAASELYAMVSEIERVASEIGPPPPPAPVVIDYAGLASEHNKRRHKKK